MNWELLNEVKKAKEQVEKTAKVRELIEDLVAEFVQVVQSRPKGQWVNTKLKKADIDLLKEWGAEKVLAAICREVEKKVGMPEGSIKGKIARTVIVFSWKREK